VTEESPGPGQPGHGLNTVAEVKLHPGSSDQYVFSCAACDNAEVVYDQGPYSEEEALARLELHRGMNTPRARLVAQFGGLPPLRRTEYPSE
jgi:hypothetical protein